MGEVAVKPTRDRATIIEQLEGRGTRRDVAAQYADAYLEYWEASDNIAEHGAMVLHPRTNNPIENPYLQIRDRALAKLQKMRAVRADWLW
jgi:phage terminase small subunit